CRLSATVGAIVKAFENFIAVIAPVVLAFALMDPFSICGKAEFISRPYLPGSTVFKYAKKACRKQT
ncbi:MULTISPECIES: hypothetical protein, partial [Blautia]|uniref:hypothetical protein n=1 Tax=Blautia TaxID=572511 RepID=UPI00197A8CF8